MINLGLTNLQYQQYCSTLSTSHSIRVTVKVLNRDEVEVKSIPHAVVLDGGVSFDATQTISRSLTIKFLDPDHQLTFDQNNPSQVALFADNFIQIKYGVWVPAMTAWVDMNVFTGPITKFSRQGPEVTVEAMGKESLGLDPHLVVADYNLAKGLLVRNAMKDVMTRMGETKFHLDSVSGRLHSHRPVTKGESPWHIVAGGPSDSATAIGGRPSLVRKANNRPYIYYDGSGFMTSKEKNSQNKWTFDKFQVLSEPGFEYDILEIINHVICIGGTPKNSKQNFKGQASLPGDNPFSPTALARNGKPRYMTYFFQSDTLKSNAACKRKAEAILTEKDNQGVTASFESLPIPHLEEHDHITLAINGYQFSFPLKTWTLPLTPETSMTVGSTKETRNPRRKRRRKRH